MKRSFLTFAAVGVLALAGVATTMPAQARDLGPAIAGAAVGTAIAAGVASSAYAYDAGPGYAYEPGPAYDAYAYDAGPGYYAPYQPHRYNRNTYGTWDQSAHGGQPTYTRPQ
jgi:hypothetical protein